MKKFLSLLLCLAMALSLAACGGGGQPANNSVPPSEPAQTESTPPVEESTAPAAEFTPVPAGETITLDFMELTIGNVGSGAKLTEGNSSLVTSNESNGYYWLDATLMNTAGQAIPLYNMDVRMVFDDKYTYEGDVRCFTGSDMDPLVQNHIYIYAEIPKTLMDSYQSVTIQFGFNDEFADYDYEQFNYELALENFQNLYEFTYTKGDDTASSASAEGAAAASGENSGTKTISAGETITTDDYEFTLNAVEFSYEVLPADTTGYYNYYSPESGNVYIHVDATVKNLMKRDIQIGEIMTAEAIYGDGYSYKGFAVVEDGSSFNFASSWSAAAPLQSCNAHYLIECPDEVESSSDPLVVGITLSDGVTYLYTMR